MNTRESTLGLESFLAAYVLGRYYAGLGSVMNFHDELLVFAYERQTICDSQNSPYYLECLQGIATGRNSEDLQTKSAIEVSSGKVSMQDIRKAYQAFDLEFESQIHDEDTIIGMFQSRIADSPKQEPGLRHDLSIIGEHRNSARIKQFASDCRVPFLSFSTIANVEVAISTAEQAFLWLNATEDMGDDFLTSMYGVKVSNVRMATVGTRTISLHEEILRKHLSQVQSLTY